VQQNIVWGDGKPSAQNFKTVMLSTLTVVDAVKQCRTSRGPQHPTAWRAQKVADL
jgi:hypothetical protein